ncbi:MAG: cytochrome c oxidase assembly protein [Alphaproteobacteria bacterium]|nr:cytochrome c oxidase assembly protein [Alphaproteobacteria bacterium]
MARALDKGQVKTVAGVLGVIGFMTGLTIAAVPLYELFCQVTGFGGTTQRADAAPEEAGAREITVRFDSNTSGIDWKFIPVQTEIDLKVGEERLGFYQATNTSDTPLVGTSTYSVTPHKAGPYFSKIQCFCFTEQVLLPGETVDMPVTFFIEPDIVEDENLADVDTITLSYTFFQAKGESADEALAERVSAVETETENTLN